MGSQNLCTYDSRANILSISNHIISCIVNENTSHIFPFDWRPIPVSLAFKKECFWTYTAIFHAIKEGVRQVHMYKTIHFLGQ